MTQLRIRLLGAPRVEVDGAPVQIGLRKATALLAYLAMTPGVHQRDHLGALLWPDAAPSRVYAYLRNVIWALNRTPLSDWLDADRQTLKLRYEADLSPAPSDASGTTLTIDAQDLLFALEAMASHGHNRLTTCEACAARLAEAVETWQGDFLQGFSLRDSPAFDDWQSQQSVLLRDAATRALSILARWCARIQDLDRAIDYGRRRVELDPLDEPAHRALIRLYLQAGRRADAVRQYEACAASLDSELGIAPSPKTRNLLDPKRSSESDLVSEMPPEPTSAATNLPCARTSLIGREREIETVVSLLRDPNVRLLTLTGVGGTGKTRLAIAAAQSLSGDFRDGVTFVDLSPVRAPTYVLSALADALGVRNIARESTVARDTRGHAEAVLHRLIWHLQNRQKLLVVDNYEHLLSAADLPGRLLAAAPLLKILVTSRAPLNVYGEHLLTVPPLGLPSDGLLPEIERSDAVRLLVARARAVRPDFRMTPTNATTLVDICRRLDGLPLALELAAARLRTLTPQSLQALLVDRLDGLSGGPRDVPARQQALYATIGWSYGLLPRLERVLFRRLAIFVGGFTLAAAEEVVGDDLTGQVANLLDRLADHSLVSRPILPADEMAPGAIAVPGRFRMLETVRDYALSLLAESPERDKVRQRHAAAMLVLVEEGEIACRAYGRRQATWLRRVQADLDNVRAALSWASEAEPQLALRLATAMGRYWQARLQPGEGLDWLARLLASPMPGDAADKHLRARALTRRVELAWDGNRSDAILFSVEALAAWAELDDLEGEGLALAHLGRVLVDAGQVDEGECRFADASDLLRKAGAQLALAEALCLRADVFHTRNAQAVVEASAREAYAIGQRLGAGRVVARARYFLGWAAMARLENAAAETHFTYSLEQASASEDLRRMVTCFSFLGANAYYAGRPDEAVTYYRRCLSNRHRTGPSTTYRWALHNLAGDALDRGQMRLVHNYLEAAYALPASLGDDYALSHLLPNLAWSRLRRGQRNRAAALCRQALDLGLRRHDDAVVYMSLRTLGLIELDAGRAAGAASIIGAALGLLDAWPGPLPLDRPAYRDEVGRALGQIARRLGTPALERLLAEGREVAAEGAVAAAAYVRRLAPAWSGPH